MGSWVEGVGAGDSRREPMSFSADQWTIDKLPTLEKWKREKAASLKLPRRVSRWERGEKGECLFVSVRQSESEREREREREWKSDVFQRVKIIYRTLSLTHPFSLTPPFAHAHTLTHTRSLSLLHALTSRNEYSKNWEQGGVRDRADTEQRRSFNFHLI